METERPSTPKISSTARLILSSHKKHENLYHKDPHIDLHVMLHDHNYCAVEKVLEAAAATPSSSKILKVHPKKKKRKPLTSKGTARRHVSSPLPGQSWTKNNPIKLQDNVSFGGDFDLATNEVEPAVPAEVKVQNVCKKKFVCYHCGYRAKHFKPLKRHILIKHLNHRPFSCTQCDYRAVFSSQLKIHVWAKHTDIKPFQCALCNYNTAYRAHLKQHMVAMHSDTRPFKCKLCDFCTGYTYGLKKHVANKHTDSQPRPFQCKLCSYNTPYSHSLKQHVMHRHSDTKPFNCTQCAYSAALKSYLTRHIHTKHLFSEVSVIRKHFNLNS